MAASTSRSEQLIVVRDGDIRLRWVPSTPVLAKVAERVRTRLAAEAQDSQHVFVGHGASIPDDG